MNFLNKHILSSLLTGGEETIDGFINFVYKDIIPACFEAPLQKEFDMNDAQFFLVSFLLHFI